MKPGLLITAAVLWLTGCAGGEPSRASWYKPSAFTIGATAPDLIASPLIRGTPPHRNGPVDTVGVVATLTFPLFPVPTRPEGPYSLPGEQPAKSFTPTP